MLRALPLASLLLLSLLLAGCSAGEDDGEGALTTSTSSTDTTTGNATSSSTSSSASSTSPTMTTTSSASSSSSSSTTTTTAPAANATGNATEEPAAPAVIQTVSCDILVGLPVPVRVLGAEAPVVGPLPGIGGCLTDALAQESVLVAIGFPDACFADPEAVVGDTYDAEQAFDIYCDPTVTETTVSLDFGAAPAA